VIGPPRTRFLKRTKKCTEVGEGTLSERQGGDAEKTPDLKNICPPQRNTPIYIHVPSGERKVGYKRKKKDPTKVPEGKEKKSNTVGGRKSGRVKD